MSLPDPNLRIGLFGGSFDPIHNGHLIIALDACEQFELDRVLFVPAFQAPLKDKAPETTPEQRMKMLQLAIEGELRELEGKSRELTAVWQAEREKLAGSQKTQPPGSTCCLTSGDVYV